MNSIVSITIVSIFCAGGLFAYLREAVRLHRLLSTGKVATAKIVGLDKEDSGSESVVHYLVRYEFMDETGKTLTHEQDLNSSKYFKNLTIGDSIDVLYVEESENSYPLSQVRKDWKLSCYIAISILVFWAAMTAYFVFSK